MFFSGEISVRIGFLCFVFSKKNVCVVELNLRFLSCEVSFLLLIGFFHADLFGLCLALGF